MSQSLAQLGAKLKKEGRGDLRRKLLRNIRAEAAPLLQEARQSALDTLPKTGGLNRLVAGSKFTVRTSLSRNARVRLIGAQGHDIKAMDRGRLRHPTFDHDPWVTQQIQPGWWTQPMRDGSPRVRRAIVNTARQIGREL